MTDGSRTGTPLVVPIKRRPKTEPAESFDGLRAAGMAHIQALCGDTWTDHNLHDPGITMLEALCYGLSELAYRAELPVADHLTGKHGAIDFRRQSLHPPELVFPCRPTTLADYRRVLIDALDGAGSVSITCKAPGVFRLAMHCPRVAPERLADHKEAVRRRFWASRNLCEDIDEDIAVVNEALIELRGEIEVGGAQDPAAILAEIYHRCERCIDAPVTFRSMDEALHEGRPLDEVFDGPVLVNGFISDADIARQDRETLFVGDLMESVRDVPGVAEPRGLGLQRVDTTDASKVDSGSLRWRWNDEAGERWALRLKLPESGDAACSLTVVRRGSVVPVSPHDVVGKLEELRAAARTLNRRNKDGDASCPRPSGTHRELAGYYSVQHHFPAIYGINAHGLPSTATPQRRAQARQLKAYLMLFEQPMAHAAMQLQHLRDLFSAHDTSGQTQWWQMLDEQAVPDIEPLYARTPQAIEKEVYKPLDRYADRKSRVLDHLLALLGQACPQRSLRQFADHYSAGELEAMLLENKLELVKDVLAFGRQRGSGFDYSKSLDSHPANRSGLARRVGLLLGFKPRPSPWLASDGDSDDRPLPALLQGARRLDTNEAARHWSRLLPAPAASWTAATPSHAQGVEAADGLLRAGVFANRYWWSETSGGRGHLIIGPDEDGSYWLLGEAQRREDGVRVAAGVRDSLLARDVQAEGMHVVEHLLLRPVGGAAATVDASASDAFALSVVFPNWTVRSRQAGFRLFAQETVDINCPAHVHAHCLWLSVPRMREFERLYRRWLATRVAWCAQPQRRAGPMNEAARELADWLLEHRPQEDAA